MAKVYCKKCQFYSDPIPYNDGVGITYTNNLCKHSSNVLKQDSWDGEKEIYVSHPAELNKTNACQNFVALEIQDTVNPTKEQLAEILTAKKIAFGQSLIQDFSTMNTLRGLTTEQIIATGQQFADLQMLLMAGSIETSYQIISLLQPSEFITLEIIDCFKGKIEAFMLETADLRSQLIAMVQGGGQ